MLNGDKVIRIFCWVDDLLNGVGHKEYCRVKVSDSEVITTAIVALFCPVMATPCFIAVNTAGINLKE